MEESVRTYDENVKESSEDIDFHTGRSLTLLDLFHLFVKPRTFFSDQIALGNKPYLAFVLFIVGFGYFLERLDKNLLKIELGTETTTLWLGIASSQSFFLGAGFVSAIISGVMIWHLGGWWYKKRLEWCGAMDDLDFYDQETMVFDSRTVFVYSSFIRAFPSVLVALIALPIHGSYYNYFIHESQADLLLLLFPVWSIIVSYIGVRTVFTVKKGLARLWFLILPLLLLALLIGLLSAL